MTTKADPFAWVKDLATKPFAVCVACRQPFWVDEGPRCRCGAMSMFDIYKSAMRNAMTDRIIAKRSKRA